MLALANTLHAPRTYQHSSSLHGMQASPAPCQHQRHGGSELAQKSEVESRLLPKWQNQLRAGATRF